MPHPQEQNNAASANIPNVLLAYDPPTTTFQPFPRLPIEFRKEIWKLLFPGPRVIEFSFNERNDPHWKPREIQIDRHPTYWEWVVGVGTLYTNPLLLRVNHESREFILRSYSKLENCRVASSSSLGGVYVDYSRDTFHFSRESWVLTENALKDAFVSFKRPLPPLDPKLTKYISLDGGIDWIEDSCRMGGEARLARHLGLMWKHWTCLEALWLTLDRREISYLTIKDSLVDPDEEDSLMSYNMARFSEKLELAVDELRLQHPDLNIPTFGWKFLVNDD